MSFQFNLRDEVIDEDGNEGIIIGRFEFVTTSPGYVISYPSEDGSTSDRYKSEDVLTKKGETEA